MQLEYSAVIRCTGRNPHVEQLLQSLAEQSLPPKEVLIVLPHGVPPWDTPYEVRFIHSPRGMVTQRAEGIKAASSRYLLLLDDDITFNDTHAIEKLFTEMLRHSAHVALP